jgi:hypothetical protein
MNDRDLERSKERAEHAQRLLNDSLLQEAMQAIRNEVVRAWVDCPARDTEGKEALWQLARTADKFDALLRGYVETGKLATANLKHFEERKGLRRVFG